MFERKHGIIAVDKDTQILYWEPHTQKEKMRAIIETCLRLGIVIPREFVEEWNDAAREGSPPIEEN